VLSISGCYGVKQSTYSWLFNGLLIISSDLMAVEIFPV
jgi:hypothetical protein